TGIKVKGRVTSPTGDVKGGSVFLFSSDGEPLNPIDALSMKAGVFETFPLEPGTWFAVAAFGFDWSPVKRFVVPAHGEPDAIELEYAPVAKLTVDIVGMEPAWVDVRDANHCSLSSLLDKKCYDRTVVNDWSPGRYLYRLPAGNYDVAAVGATERRTAHVSL